MPYCIFAQAQIERSVVNTTGSSYKGGILSIDYSVGEVLAGTETCQTMFLNQGFIQADQTTTGVKFIGEKFSIEAYPNPASGSVHIILTTNNEILKYLSIKLIDLKGTTLRTTDRTNISGKLVELIDMTDLPNGTYFIKFENKTFNKMVMIVKID